MLLRETLGTNRQKILFGMEMVIRGRVSCIRTHLLFLNSQEKQIIASLRTYNYGNGGERKFVNVENRSEFTILAH